MKTIHLHIFFLTVSLFFLSCSSDNEIFDSKIVNEDSQEKDQPNGAVVIPGLPQSIKKYQDGNLYYRAQYYYRPDGKLLKVNYSHPEASSEIFTDTYHYNTEGKLISMEGHDDYNFYWDKNRIVEADKYNAMWYGRSKIYYEYNPKGQLIQRTENYLDFLFQEKTIYTYFENGNLKTIEQFGDYNDSGQFTLYSVTNFEGYIEDKNLFLELEIIPGQIVQHQFPSSMNYKHLTETGYEREETYTYKYDADGRVIEKIFGSNKVVYQYY